MRRAKVITKDGVCKAPAWTALGKLDEDPGTWAGQRHYWGKNRGLTESLYVEATKVANLIAHILFLGLYLTI